MAAYNAGPGNVAKIRRAARKMGYDPNLWFGNCEMAALKVVSMEPVQYVRNINKYYVALKLSYAQEIEGDEKRRSQGIKEQAY